MPPGRITVEVIQLHDPTPLTDVDLPAVCSAGQSVTQASADRDTA